MIGLGTQDSADEARDFVAEFGTVSFPMLWDETFETWTAFGVTSQPAAALLTTDGELLGAWLGAVPEDQVVQLAAEATG